jgi:hypothetical protein
VALVGVHLAHFFITFPSPFRYAALSGTDAFRAPVLWCRQRDDFRFHAVRLAWQTRCEVSRALHSSPSFCACTIFPTFSRTGTSIYTLSPPTSRPPLRTLYLLSPPRLLPHVNHSLTYALFLLEVHPESRRTKRMGGRGVQRCVRSLPCDFFFSTLWGGGKGEAMLARRSARGRIEDAQRGVQQDNPSPRQAGGPWVCALPGCSWA